MHSLLSVLFQEKRSSRSTGRDQLRDNWQSLLSFAPGVLFASAAALAVAAAFFRFVESVEGEAQDRWRERARRLWLAVERSRWLGLPERVTRFVVSFSQRRFARGGRSFFSPLGSKWGLAFVLISLVGMSIFIAPYVPPWRFLVGALVLGGLLSFARKSDHPFFLAFQLAVL